VKTPLKLAGAYGETIAINPKMVMALVARLDPNPPFTPLKETFVFVVGLPSPFQCKGSPDEILDMIAELNAFE
jgi:hypothetical protein